MHHQSGAVLYLSLEKLKEAFLGGVTVRAMSRNTQGGFARRVRNTSSAASFFLLGAVFDPIFESYNIRRRIRLSYPTIARRSPIVETEHAFQVTDCQSDHVGCKVTRLCNSKIHRSNRLVKWLFDSGCTCRTSSEFRNVQYERSERHLHRTMINRPRTLQQVNLSGHDDITALRR
jgi:hypothetical protein